MSGASSGDDGLRRVLRIMTVLTEQDVGDLRRALRAEPVDTFKGGYALTGVSVGVSRVLERAGYSVTVDDRTGCITVRENGASR